MKTKIVVMVYDLTCLNGAAYLEKITHERTARPMTLAEKIVAHQAMGIK